MQNLYKSYIISYTNKPSIYPTTIVLGCGSLSTLSTNYSAQNNTSINVGPVHTRNGAHSTTNTNTSVLLTRVHYRNMFNQISANEFNNTEHKRSEIMLSPIVSLICDNAKSDIEKKKVCNTKWNYSFIKQILYSDLKLNKELYETISDFAIDIDLMDAIICSFYDTNKK